jgi:(2Fe-2S) ferredoxin
VSKGPLYDVWICQGRMCTALGADALSEKANALVADGLSGGRCRLLRGGCYGLCEMAPNVVVRRWTSEGRLPDVSVDRLQLTGRGNETVYSRVTAPGLGRLLASHLEDDAPVEELTLASKEDEVAPESKTAASLRRLRRLKR